jgi:hypothetical protein
MLHNGSVRSLHQCGFFHIFLPSAGAHM